MLQSSVRTSRAAPAAWLGWVSDADIRPTFGHLLGSGGLLLARELGLPAREDGAVQRKLPVCGWGGGGGHVNGADGRRGAGRLGRRALLLLLLPKAGEGGEVGEQAAALLLLLVLVVLLLLLLGLGAPRLARPVLVHDPAHVVGARAGWWGRDGGCAGVSSTQATLAERPSRGTHNPLLRAPMCVVG
jgi:hypothetical protein